MTHNGWCAQTARLDLGIQALKRVAQPDDIGDVITFLASDAEET